MIHLSFILLWWLTDFDHGPSFDSVQSAGLSDQAAPSVVDQPAGGWSFQDSKIEFFPWPEPDHHSSGASSASGEFSPAGPGSEVLLPRALVEDDDIPTFLGTYPQDSGGRLLERSVRLTAVGRSLLGRVQVREHQFEGTPLNLSGDLGYGFQGGGRAGFTYANSNLETLLEVEYVDGSGSRTASRDFSFNGAFYAAGENTRTLTHFLTVRLHLAWKSFSDPAGGWWTGPVLGIEYPYYYMNLTSPLDPHNSEDWTHYDPYPVIGWAGRVRLAEGLSWGGRATVGYFPNLPSAYTEGGRLYVSVRPSVWVDLPLTWDVSRSVRLSAGFEYQYWQGGDHSVEDGNTLRFSSAGGTLALEFSW